MTYTLFPLKGTKYARILDESGQMVASVRSVAEAEMFMAAPEAIDLLRAIVNVMEECDSPMQKFDFWPYSGKAADLLTRLEKLC